MKTTGICFIVATATSLVVGQNAAAMLVDFNFSISYSGSSFTGRLVGLNLDANGNGVEVDPASVLLFHVPTIVGLTASPSHPYVFVPHTFERSTYFSGTLISTTPGVYGFQVSNYTLSPPSQNLLMMDAGNDVTLVFNFGAGLCGECGVATYGIQAEEDALWPAINSFVSFSAVSLPGDFNNDLVVDAADYIAWRKTDGTQGNYDTWRTNFGQAAGAGTTTGLAAIDRVPEPATIVILFVGVMLLPLPHRMLRPQWSSTMKTTYGLIAAMVVLPCGSARAATVLFDFNNGPQYSSLPLDLTVDGVTAQFSATGQGFSIQNSAQVIGVLPTCFSRPGNCSR